MRGRWGAMLLLVAALTVAGPGTVSLQAGEAPQDRGRPSEGESPGDRAPETPPGQESDDTQSDDTQSGETQDGGTTEPTSDTGGGPAADEPTGDGTSQDPATTGGPVGGTGGDTGAGGGGGGADTGTATPEPPPPPQPDLTGTRVLRSLLGTAREVDADGEAIVLRDLRVAVTETGASGIDGGWWVTVTTRDGEVAVTPPTLSMDGNGGVPRAPDEVSVGGGPLFWITGQRSDQRYEGRYEAQGTVGMPSVDGIEKPVITILLVQ